MPKRPNLAGLGLAIRASGGAEDEHPVDAIVDDAGTIINVPLAALDPNPNQPRQHFDPETMNELTQSVKERGVLQPILTRRNGDRYIIIAGERRVRAATAAGLTKIPALVRQDDDPEELALIENLQREDLNPIEEAEALLRLKQRHHYTDEALAKVIGKSRKSINDSLALTRLPDAIKDQWRTSAKVQKSLLLQLLRAPNSEAQATLNQQLNDGALTVREARKHASHAKPRKPGPKPYSFKYQPGDGRFAVRVSFRKSRVSNQELRQALSEARNSVH